MGEEDAFDVEDIVGKAKAAIQEAGVGAPGAGVVVDKVELVLSVVRDLDAGLDAKWVVPIIGLSVEAKAQHKWSTTSTVDVTLVPPGATKLGLRGPDLQSDLAKAILLVRDSVTAAAAGEPPFELDSGKVTIDFGVTSTGSLSLVAEGGGEAATTQKLTLSLGPPAKPN